MFTKPCPRVTLMKASRQTSTNICGCCTKDSEKLLTWLPFIIVSGFIAPNILPSRYLFNSSEVARGSLAILSKPTDSRLQYDEQRLWNAGQVTHKLGASLRGWMEKTCLSEPEKNTVESSFRLIHYRPLAERANQARPKTFQTPKDTPEGIVWV